MRTGTGKRQKHNFTDASLQWTLWHYMNRGGWRDFAIICDIIGISFSLLETGSAVEMWNQYLLKKRKADKLLEFRLAKH